MQLDCLFFGRADLAVGREKQAFAADIASHPYYLANDPQGGHRGAAAKGDEGDEGEEGEAGEEGEEGEQGGEGEDGGSSVEDGGTSDEDDFPPSSRLVTTAFERAGPGLRCGASCTTQLTTQLAAALAEGGGAATMCAQLDVDSCAAAKQACVHLRDEADSSYLFSSPTSTRAPPCAAEAVFLCDAAIARAGSDANLVGLQRAIAANAAGARRALLALGHAASTVRQVGVPMASVGAETQLVERFHRGGEGAPALHHRPSDGLDAQGTRPSSLLLTSILVLDDEEEGGNGEGGGGGSDAGGGDAPAMLRTVRARGLKRRLPQGSANAAVAASQTATEAEVEAAAGSASSLVEVSFRPKAGDLLLLRPEVPRSLAGGRASITLWWQIDLEDSATAALATAATATATATVATAVTATATTTTAALTAAATAALTAAATAASVSASPEPRVFDGMITPATRAALNSMPPVRLR